MPRSAAPPIKEKTRKPRPGARTSASRRLAGAEGGLLGAPSNCLGSQAFSGALCAQGVLVLSIVFKIVNSFLIHAVKATLGGLPALHKRV